MDQRHWRDEEAAGSPDKPDVLSDHEDDDAGPRAAPGRLRKILLAALVVLVGVGYGPDLLRFRDRPAPRRDPPPVADGGSTPSPSRPGASAATASPQPSATATSGPLSWPLRGDLAGDPTALAAIRTGLRSRGLAGARPLYAGTVRGGRLVLVASPAGAPGEPVTVQAVYVPFGSDPARAPTEEIEGYGSHSGERFLTGWAGPVVGGERSVVVLGGPGPLRVEVLTALRFQPDGSVRRSWQAVGGSDGVVLTTVRPLPIGPAVVRSRPRASLSVPLVLGPMPEDSSAQRVEVAGLSGPSYRGPEPAGVLSEMGAVAAFLADGTGFRVLWSGALSSSARAVVVQARLAGGGVLNFALASRGGGAGDVETTGASSVPWEGADSYPTVLEDVSTTGAGSPRRYLVSPSGRGSAEFERRGKRLARRDLDEAGVARIDGVEGLGSEAGPPPEDLRVTVRDGRGRIVANTPVARLGSFDPFGFTQDGDGER